MLEKSEWEFTKNLGNAKVVCRIVLVKMHMGKTEYWSYQTILAMETETDKVQIRNFA